MTARYKHETRFLYGRKAPIPPNCDAIEALLRLELLTQFPNWLSQKATMLGCTSSHDILKMALKEIFPNEDATRFDLVEELYSLPQKPPSTMHTFAAWLEDWVTKLVAADEISAYVEPRRAMAVLSHVGKPLQAQDTLFMTEWVAIFRESGLRDDVSVNNLREACLQLVVCARARARELQVDVQVERASRAVVTANTGIPTKGKSMPAMESAVCKFFLTADGCKFGDECKFKHPRTNGKCLRCGAEGHSLSSCTRPSKTKSDKQSKSSPKGKGRSSQTPTSSKPSSDAKAKAQPKKDGAKGKGKGKKDKSSNKPSAKSSTTPSNKSSAKSSTKTSAKSGEVSFDNDDAEEEAQDAEYEWGEEDAEQVEEEQLEYVEPEDQAFATPYHSHVGAVNNEDGDAVPPLHSMTSDEETSETPWMTGKKVTLRLAAGQVQAVEHQREIFADHVTVPLCPLGRVIRKLGLTAIWTPQSLTLTCVNSAGTAHGLMQCPVKGDTPYFTSVQFWMLRRALQAHRQGQKTFPPTYWKQLYTTAIREGPHTVYGKVNRGDPGIQT